MRLFLTIFWIILAFFFLWVFSLNVGQTVTVDLFFAKFEAVNLITVIFSSLFIGFAFGIIFFLIQFAKSKKENFLIKKQFNALQSELENLKNNSNKTQDLIDAPNKEQDGEEDNPERKDL